MYKFCDEEILTPEMMSRLYMRSPDGKITNEDISTHNTDASIRLSPDDIIVQNMKISYGMKNKNPVDKTLFFKSSKRK